MACGALSRVLPSPKQAPLAWLADFNRRPLRRVFMGAGLAGVFQVAQFYAHGETVSALILILLLPICAGAAAFLTVRTSCAGLEPVLTYLLLSAANAVAAGVVPFAHDLTIRLRGLSGVNIFFKVAPGLLGFPLSMSAVYMALSLAADIVALELCHSRHGDSNQLRIYLSYGLSAVAGIGMSWVTSERLWSIFDAQEALASEMTLMEKIIAMMCDSSVWLAEDGCIVVREDPRFMMMAGRSMVGRPLSDTFASQERSRLQDAVLQARSSPALLPSTLRTAAGSQVRVELFIVGNRGVGTRAQTSGELTPSFLIGVRGCSLGEDMPGVGRDLAPQVHAASMPEVDGPPTTEADMMDLPNESGELQPAPNVLGISMSDTTPVGRGEATCSECSEVQTTVTGHIFDSVKADRSLAGAPKDQLQALRRGLESVIALGKAERWIVSAGDLEVHAQRVLGKGSFGSVTLGSLHGTPVAVKSVRYSAPTGAASRLQSLTNEIRVLRHIRHPCVVLFGGACMDSELGVVLLVLELVPGTTLDRYVQAHSEGSEAPIRQLLLLDLACALRYLHAQEPQIVHGDLKGSNALVDPRIPRAKLTDFGLARVLSRSARPLGGTVSWMAPEVIRSPNGKPRSSADVFSFGRMAYLAVACREPLKGMRRSRIVAMAQSGREHKLHWREDGPLHRECRDLCARALSLDPEKRPTMAQVHAEVAAWRAAPASEGVPRGRRFALAMAWRRAEGRDPGAGRGALTSPLDARGADPGAVGQPACAGSGERPPAGPGPLVVPAWRRTRESVKKAMLLEVAQRWNFPLRQGGCCEFHMAASELQLVSSALAQHTCEADFRPPSAWQCSDCGVLDEEAQSVCPVCCRQAAPMPGIKEADERRAEEEEGGAPFQQDASPPGSRCSL